MNFKGIAEAFSSLKKELLEFAKKVIFSNPSESKTRLLTRVKSRLSAFRKEFLADNVEKAILASFQEFDEDVLTSLQKAGIIVDRKFTNKFYEVARSIESQFFYAIDPALVSVNVFVQRLIRQQVLARMLASQSNDPEIAKTKLLASIDEGFISLSGKDGVSRRYDLSAYGKLVTSFFDIRAKTASTVLRLKQHKHDLVIITGGPSKHGDFCDGYVGRAFSISEKNSEYPFLLNAPNGGPPFHPHCTHEVQPFFPELVTQDELMLAKSFNRDLLLLHKNDSANAINERYKRSLQ